MTKIKASLKTKRWNGYRKNVLTWHFQYLGFDSRINPKHYGLFLMEHVWKDDAQNDQVGKLVNLQNHNVVWN